MGVKLLEQPVLLTYGHVTFNEIPNWKERVEADVKTSFVDGGYPLNEFGTRINTSLSPSVQQDGRTVLALQTKQTETWTFTTIDQHTAFVLTSSSLSLVTSDYMGFDDFSGRFKFGLDIVARNLDPKAATRSGLRYINLVRTSEDKHFNSLLDQRILAYADGLNDYEVRHAMTESVLKTDEGELLLRGVCAKGNLIVPGDLLPLPVLFPEKTQVNDIGKFSIVDIGHVVQKNVEFSQETMLARLNNSHEIIYNAFLSVSTSEAIKSWKPLEQGS